MKRILLVLAGLALFGCEKECYTCTVTTVYQPYNGGTPTVTEVNQTACTSKEVKAVQAKGHGPQISTTAGVRITTTVGVSCTKQ